MPGRRRRSGRSPAPDAGAASVDRDRFPTLATLFGGYLHEDFEHLHGSLEGAVAAFAADASDAERRALVVELARLAAHAPRMSLADLQNLIGHDLRSRWLPESLSDLDRLVEAVRQALHD